MRADSISIGKDSIEHLIHRATALLDKPTKPKVRSKTTTDATPVNRKPSNPKKRNSLLSIGLKASKYTGLTIGYLILGFLAALKTPGIHNAGNKVLQWTGNIPQPTNVRVDDTPNEHIRFDQFFANHPQFDNIKHISSYYFDPSTADLNNNGILLDTSEEARFYKNSLQKSAHSNPSNAREINTALSDFSEVNFINELIWGKSSDPRNLLQGSKPNCQLMGAIQAHFLTSENLQKIKSTIKVTNYSLSENDFYIDTIVNLNGKEISVPYNDLVKWMSPRWGAPPRSYDGALAIPILTYALEKELTENYDGIPPIFPSAAPILLTGDNFSTISIHSSFLLNTMSDSALIEILQKAPQKLVLVASNGELEEIIENIKEWIDKKINGKKKDSFLLPPTSPEKEDEFKEKTKERASEIFASVFNQDTTKNLDAANRTLQRRESSYYPANHLYVVESYNPTNNTVQLIDSHGVKYQPLPFKEFRERFGAVIVLSEDVPIVTTESLKAYFLLLLFAGGHITLGRLLKRKKS